MRESVSMGCMGDLVLLKKHRLSPTASLVLGRHSADLANFLKKHRVACFGTTADSCSVSKQAQRSFFRIPRILEKDNQGGFEKSTENQKQPQSKKVDSRSNALLSSSRALAQDKAGQSTQPQSLESTFEKTEQKTQKADSRDNVLLSSSRDFRKEVVAIHKSAQVDFSDDYSASAESMDCHAVQAVLPMTEKKAANKKADSKKTTQSIKKPQNKKAEILKADSSDSANILSKSQVSLEKPTPNTQKTPKAKQTKDSRILELESGLLLKKPAAAAPCTASLVFKPRKEIRLGRLSTQRGDEIHDSSPKAESTKPKPRKALYIDKEAISSLALVQEGLLSPIASLANSKTLDLSKDSYLTPFVLNPAGKRNRKVLESTKPNEVLDIVFEQRSVGYLRVEEVFPIDRHARTIQLTGLQGGAEFDRIYSRLGDYAVCGEYQVDFPDIKEAKASLQEQIATHNAKHITGLVLDGQVFHNAHEAFIRDALSTSDLVVLFLLKPYRDTLIHYDMQKQCVEFAMRHFLVSDRMCIIPLDDTYLFMGTNNVLLHAMVARNYGCTHFIVSDNTPNLSVFYERNTLYSVLDMVSGISTSIKGGYVYCNTCQMLINRTTCPHGKHHHISYNTESILEFFKVGLLPPSVLVRPSIAAKLLAHLFPNRFSNLQKLYYDLMPFDEGVLLPKSEEDFYLELMRLYELRSK
ncbi:hypothetical protein [Helicobacter canis]|uniref:Sulfate adenylyltransferase n=1 Tax=Helicobacter canis TaxID=29419 RepID=A0A377J4B2_9HELI|nr:hypothetical protein [Helicobacter canis]STO97145.1 sulfate adenylyltransferase [Helicobacter canis]